MTIYRSINATPAARDFDLWTPAEDPVSGAAEGRTAITADRAVAILHERYPDRAVNYVSTPYDETATYSSWVTRGFDPWTREGGAGNTYVMLDQYTGETLYDGSPEDGNVFDQAWDDWSFPVHTGDFGGTITRVLWVGLGLSPLVLGVTVARSEPSAVSRSAHRAMPIWEPPQRPDQRP